ncbi:MAG: hypothetical protein GXO39_02255 [Thermotogae bacterium]|nr:hypothetical protein [Thermotogota bacterium]
MMTKRGILVIFVAVSAALSFGCRKEKEYAGYLDPKHVRLFARPGEWWEGHDVTEMPDGRYVVTGVRDFAGDSMMIPVIVLSPSGDSLGLFYIKDRARGTNVVALPGNRVALENNIGSAHIVSLTDGSIESHLEFGNFRTTKYDNDALVYDSSSNSLITLWRDDGLCLHQVFLDGSDGWLACSGIDSRIVYMKEVKDGYIVQGTALGGVFFFKVNRVGEVKWSREVEVPLLAVHLEDFEITDDGNILLAIESGNLTPTVVKMDTLGNILWVKDYEYPGGDIDRMRVISFKIVRIAPKRYFLVATNVQCGHCISVVKIDGEGNVLMAKNYIWHSFHWMWNAIRTSDGNVLIVGTSKEDSTSYLFLLKLDPNGNSIW